jgi:hypothetical protein
MFRIVIEVINDNLRHILACLIKAYVSMFKMFNKSLRQNVLRRWCFVFVIRSLLVLG